MRHFGCVASPSSLPSLAAAHRAPAAWWSSSELSRRSSAFFRRSLMNFHGARFSPTQSSHGNAADAARVRSVSDEELARRDSDVQRLLGSGRAGGGLSSSGHGEFNWDWNLEQERHHYQQQQREIWRGRGDGEQRWKERRGWNGSEANGWEETASSVSGGSCVNFSGWGGREGRGERGNSGGRSGEFIYQAKSNDSERQPRSADFTPRDGRFIRSRYDDKRYWCSAENELPAAAAHEKFVLVSYNILADKNAFDHYNEMYYHIPYCFMKWDRRKTKLVEELGHFSPDIMCLQEVDKYEDLQQEFQRMGYRGAYKGRTGGARDGCAMFWKPSRFRLLEETSIQFNELDLRDNVAQLCVFQSIAGTAEQDLNSKNQDQNTGHKRGPGSLVIVGNIHVLFNPKRGDVKLGQLRVLLESAYALSQKYGGAPVTIAGDFNSTPYSDLYKFLATCELDVSCLNRATMSGQVMAANGAAMASMTQIGQGSSTDSARGASQNIVKKWHWTPEELLAATGTSDCTALRHNLNLRSAYSQIKGEDGCRDARGEPLVTTFHKKFIGTVDYIWHTEGIDTVKVLDTVPVNVLERTQGLPSKKWGSDHLALACELALLPGLAPNVP